MTSGLSGEGGGDREREREREEERDRGWDGGRQGGVGGSREESNPAWSALNYTMTWEREGTAKDSQDHNPDLPSPRLLRGAIPGGITVTLLSGCLFQKEKAPQRKSTHDLRAHTRWVTPHY